MYSPVQLAKKYFHYYYTASNGHGHGMHSPFVFDFIRQVLQAKRGAKPPSEIEALRKKMLQDKTPLAVEDLGAGSRVASGQKTIRRIAQTAVKPKKYSRFLFRLAQHYAPQTVIELGTSLGISTAYLAAANPAATIYTIEGSFHIQQCAVRNFEALGMGFIKSLHGPFDVVLPQVLQELDFVDLAYIDGNHRLQPTLHYFEQLLPRKTPQSIFVFDDIHWSAEMEAAWQTIQQHPEVTCTIDLFF